MQGGNTWERYVANDEGNLTSMLNAARAGDRQAADLALGRVYRELKQIAHNMLRGNAQTLNPTSLVHDAFMRLIPAADRQFADRSHFFRLAARAMRQIIVDEIRASSADKRGGQWLRTELTERLAAAGDERIDLLTIDAALGRLATFDVELAEIVEAYFFGGFTFAEIADARGSSERSVRRQWEVARLFLMREILEH